MPSGLLDSLAEWDEIKFAPILRLGEVFGHYEACLQRSDKQDPAALADLIEDINSDLDQLHLEFQVPEYERRSKRRAPDVLRTIWEMLRQKRSPSHGAYFLIGTAIGLLFNDSAEALYKRLSRIENYHPEIKIASHAFGSRLVTEWEALQREDQRKDTEYALARMGTVFQKMNSSINILFITSDPTGVEHLDTQEEHRALDDVVKGTKFKIRPRTSCRATDIQQSILEYRPQYIHFSGHGDPERGLCLQDDNRMPYFVSPEDLGELFGIAAEDGLEVVVLNACYTSAQCEAISSKVSYTIAMEGLVNDSEAVKFTSSFYRGLTHHKTVEAAFRAAKVNVPVIGNSDKCKPILMGLKVHRSVKVSEDEAVEVESSAIKLIESASDAAPGSLGDQEVLSESLETMQAKRILNTEDLQDQSRGAVERGGEEKSDEAGGTASDSHGRNTPAGDDKGTNLTGSMDGMHIDEGMKSHLPAEQPASSAQKGSPPDNDDSPMPMVRTTASKPDRSPQELLRVLANDSTFRQLVKIFQNENRSFPSVVNHLGNRGSVVIKAMLSFDEKVITRLLCGENVDNVIANPGGPLLATQKAPEPAKQHVTMPTRQQAPDFRNPFNDPFSDPFFDGFFSDRFFRSAASSFFAGPGSAHRTRVQAANRPSALQHSHVTCDRCKEPFTMRGGYHCNICRGGDFDVCTDCVQENFGCLNPSHTLIKWIVRVSP